MNSIETFILSCIEVQVRKEYSSVYDTKVRAEYTFEIIKRFLETENYKHPLFAADVSVILEKDLFIDTAYVYLCRGNNRILVEGLNGMHLIDKSQHGLHKNDGLRLLRPFITSREFDQHYKKIESFLIASFSQEMGSGAHADLEKSLSIEDLQKRREAFGPEFESWVEEKLKEIKCEGTFDLRLKPSLHGDHIFSYPTENEKDICFREHWKFNTNKPFKPEEFYNPLLDLTLHAKIEISLEYDKNNISSSIDCSFPLVVRDYNLLLEFLEKTPKRNPKFKLDVLIAYYKKDKGLPTFAPYWTQNELVLTSMIDNVIERTDNRKKKFLDALGVSSSLNLSSMNITLLEETNETGPPLDPFPNIWEL